MVHHTIPFAEKNPKKLIDHADTNDIYSNIDTIGNYEKIDNYVKTNASNTELIFSEICCRGDRKESWMRWKHWIRRLRSFVKVFHSD